MNKTQKILVTSILTGSVLAIPALISNAPEGANNNSCAKAAFSHAALHAGQGYSSPYINQNLKRACSKKGLSNG